MGRGRAKAKQTKVARDLKYRTHETDFGALARELHGDEGESEAVVPKTREVVGLGPSDCLRRTWPDVTAPLATRLRSHCGTLHARHPAGVEPHHVCDASRTAQRSQMPRIRPTSRIRCSAIRSAAVAVGTPSVSARSSTVRVVS